MFIVPAAKDNNQVSKGRAKGGLVTLWKKTLTKYVSRVKSDNVRRQATKFSFPSGSVLVVNAYFPCDPRSENFDETEIVNLLAELKLLIDQSQCHHVLLAADLNCHFERYTRFTNIVRNQLEDLQLSILWQNPDHRVEAVDYTHCSSSIILHITPQLITLG